MNIIQKNMKKIYFVQKFISSTFLKKKRSHVFAQVYKKNQKYILVMSQVQQTRDVKSVLATAIR